MPVRYNLASWDQSRHLDFGFTQYLPRQVARRSKKVKICTRCWGAMMNRSAWIRKVKNNNIFWDWHQGCWRVGWGRRMLKKWNNVWKLEGQKTLSGASWKIALTSEDDMNVLDNNICKDALMTATFDILSSSTHSAFCNRIMQCEIHDEHTIGNYANHTVKNDEHRFDKDNFETKIKSSWKRDRTSKEVGRL